jgi:copper chaperone CopZ
MKKILGLLTIAGMLLFSACNSQGRVENDEPAQTAEITFLTNIHCDGCVNTVQTKLPDNEGIIKAVAELDSKLVTVTYDPELLDAEDLIKALGELGYDAHIYTETAVPAPEEEADTAASVL